MPDEKDKPDYELEINKEGSQSKKEDLLQIPTYFKSIPLGDKEKVRLGEEVRECLDEIEEQRTANNLVNTNDGLDRQYAEKLKEDPDREYNVCIGDTVSKVDILVNSGMKAITDMVPMFNFSPTEDMVESYPDPQKANEVCIKQTDFVDHKLRFKTNFEDVMPNTLHDAALKFGGFLKVFHHIYREKRVRDEEYRGTPIEVPNPKFNPQEQESDVNPQTITMNKGFDEFLANFPGIEEIAKYRSIVEKVFEGKKPVKLKTSHKITTYNDPKFESIDPNNFYCLMKANGYEGLKSERLVGDKRKFTWWELKQLENQPTKCFFDVDALIYEDEKRTKEYPKYQSKEWDILECIFHFKLDKGESDEGEPEETKLVLWYVLEKKIVIGAIHYALNASESYYVPYYMGRGRGLYRAGIGVKMTNPDIVKSETISEALTGLSNRNRVTPIVDTGSSIIKQFANKTFTQGLPLVKKKGESLDFVSNHMRDMDLNGALAMIATITNNTERKLNISSAQSGKESMIDPKASGRKTQLLMQQTQLNIGDYVRYLKKPLEQTAAIVLQIYFQMSREGRKYKPDSKDIVGGSSVFRTIEKSEMIARSNIESRVTSYDFDKLQEKNEALTMWEMFRQDPIFNRRSESVLNMGRKIFKIMGRSWQDNVDLYLPNEAQFQQELAEATLQAVSQYLQKSAQEGKPLEIDDEVLMSLVQRARKEVGTPPDEKELKAREDADKEAEKEVTPA